MGEAENIYFTCLKYGPHEFLPETTSDQLSFSLTVQRIKNLIMVRDIYRPKGRRTAFIFFSKHCREEHKRKYPMHSIGIGEISRRCGEIWKAMTDREKAPYYEMAEEDKSRYEKEMTGWRPGQIFASSDGRDPGAPKRYMSSYIFFSNDYRPIVREKDPTLTLPEVSRCLGIAWKSLTTEQRQMYEKRANEDKERYNRDMMVYAAQRRASLKAPNLLKIQRKRVKKEKKDGTDGGESDDSVEDCLSDEEEEEEEEDDAMSESDRMEGDQWARTYA